MKLHALRNSVLVLLSVALLAACASTPAPTPAPAPAPAPAPVPAPAPAPAPPKAAIQEETVTEVTSAVAQPVTKVETAVAELTRIHFDYDQSLLTPAARDTLNANAAALKAAPVLKVQIEGHCDERGSNQYNIALGERRAQAAMKYLVDLGVEPGRLSTVSYGEEMPLVPGHDEAAWAQNRRAEFMPAK